MARISRMCYESSFYHVMIQGINRERIYAKSYMKDIFLEMLGKKSKEFNVEIIAYCIMNNHVHLLLYSESISNLTKLMASVNTKYAKLFNKANNRVGYVYRDRYRCENIFTEKHLINCIKYIHNNPVNAGLCRNPREYKYSSYCDYLNKKKINKLVAQYVDVILNNEMDMGAKFIDSDDDFGNKLDGNANEVINKYLIKRNCKICDLKSDEIRDLSKEILKTCPITKRELARLLGIERTRWYRIMEKKE